MNTVALDTATGSQFTASPPLLGTLTMNAELPSVEPGRAGRRRTASTIAGSPHATAGAPASGYGWSCRGSLPSSWTGSWLSTWAHGSMAAVLGVAAATLTTAVEPAAGLSLVPDPDDSANATITTTRNGQGGRDQGGAAVPGGDEGHQEDSSGARGARPCRSACA